MQKGILDREARRTEIFAQFFEQDIQEVAKDLQQLVDGDGLRDYLQSGKPEYLARAVHRAWFYSLHNPDFDKVRYIDETGKEIIRINQNGEIVPPDQLQNKADRPFFQKANGLPQGEFYISALDLNVEHGKVEVPYKPTVRVATPIFDATGKRRGIYIVNLLAANCVDRLLKLTPQYQQRLRILNAQGYWIKAAQPSDEWGFILPGRADMTLARTDPALWALISKDPQGQTAHNGGYFSWARIVPVKIAPGPQDTVIAEDAFLVIGSEISSEEWAAYFLGLKQTFAVVALVLLLVGSVTWIFFRARQEAQKELDRFFVLTRDMVCIAGFDGYFKRLNPAWMRTLGYTEDELLSKPFLDFVHPDDRSKTVSETVHLREGGEVISFENRYRCKDGSYRWLLWNARSVPKTQTIFASARDLTERKQMEETLRQNEEKTRLMIESIQDYAIFMLGPDGTIATWNSGAERIKGYHDEEIIGQHFSRFYPEDKIRENFPEKELLEAAQKGRVGDEGLRVRKDGSQFWANVVINAIRNSQGELLGFVKVTRDVTNRKLAEDRIQKLNEELKNRAVQLEAANKELEAFSYSVSHDLRSPLRHIHGFVELLQESPALKAEETSRRYMNVITKSTKEMGRLIDDLLTFSRTGRVEMHPKEVDMRLLLDDAISELRSDCEGRKVIWDIKPLPAVSGDPNLLHLVWVNLISNALKYTRPRPEARIEIGSVEQAPGHAGNETVFYIRDNGVGFDMNYASKLFGVFQRLHRAEDFEGTGIGLANVQRIIHRHGGRVWAKSQLDVGSTFYFSLPINPIQEVQNV